MKKKEIFLVVTTFGILILGILPAVQAQQGFPPFVRDLNWWENLGMPFFQGYWEEGDPPYYVYNDDWNQFDPDENLFFRIGFYRLVEERENDWWPNPPWRVHLWINGEEIPLLRFAVPTKLRPWLPPAHPPVIYYWYHIFGPDYFTVGEVYHLKWELWVKNPYSGSDVNFWRVFVNYDAPYIPSGAVFSFEYDLNIIQWWPP